MYKYYCIITEKLIFSEIVFILLVKLIFSEIVLILGAVVFIFS